MEDIQDLVSKHYSAKDVGDVESGRKHKSSLPCQQISYISAGYQVHFLNDGLEMQSD